MSFRLVPKSVTLNDLERRNGHYFALFQRIPVASGARCINVTFAISSPGDFLFQTGLNAADSGPTALVLLSQQLRQETSVKQKLKSGRSSSSSKQCSMR